MDILIVYPRDTGGKPHQTFEAATFVMGKITGFIPDTHTFSINDTDTPVYEGGYFSSPVPLESGDNHLTLKVIGNGNDIATQSVAVYRHSPLTIPDKAMPAYHQETFLLWRQEGDITLMAGDSFEVSVSATPDATIRLGSAGLNAELFEAKDSNTPYIDNRNIVFQEPHQTKPLIPSKGYYEGTLHIPASLEKTYENQAITLSVTTNDGETTSFECAQTLTIWATPRMGIVIRKKAVTRIEPNTEADRLTEQPEGAIVKLTGKVGNWYRCQLTDSDQYWIEADAVEILAIYAIQDKTLNEVTLAATSSDPNTSLLSLTLSEPVPVEIESDGPWVRVRVFGALNIADPITSQLDNITDVQIDMPRDELTEISIRAHRLCGYDYHYDENTLTVAIKHLPASASDTVVLLDTGHGGEEWGAIGLDGTIEKDLNLSVTQQLNNALTTAGFKVHTTRDNDKTVTLSDRQNTIEKIKPHITLSIHHNALPDGRNPLEHQGPCTFWYHSHSADLAETLQDGLVKNGKRNDYGVFFESFVLTRPTQCMAVLIELGFFTHPEEYPLLIDPTHQTRMVNEIVKSLTSFVTNVQ